MTTETKIDPGHGYTICDARDLARTEFWCEQNGQWFNPSRTTLHDASRPTTECGKVWRKPLTLPDGKPNGQSDEWEFVPEGETVKNDYLCWTESSTRWSNHGWSGETVRHAGKVAQSDFKDRIAFARRKTKPAPVEANGETPVCDAAKQQFPIKDQNGIQWLEFVDLATAEKLERDLAESQKALTALRLNISKLL